MSFYFWFESCLVPAFMLVTFWGYQPERLAAAKKLMIYTVAASVPLFLRLISLKLYYNTDNFLLAFLSYRSRGSRAIWWGMSLAFLVKCPVYFLHGWLPKAHVEAPLIGSVLLAGVILKLGCYGLIRFIWAFEVVSLA